MSLRKMLKVSLLMLLAMALAATSAHARLDLFGQLLTSMNQPNPNSEGVLQVLVKGKGKSNVGDEPLGAMPYTECINTCENCWCTQKWPPESNICICGDNIKSKNPAAAVQEVESSSNKAKSDCGDDKKVVLRTKAKSDRIPYYECIETCEICVCDRRVPELAMCICGDNIKSKNPATAIQEVESSSSKAKSDCGKNTASNSKKPAIQNLGDDIKVVLRTKAKSDRIPYYECIETCEICICDRRVPELAMCICGDNIKSKNPATAIQEVESSSSKAKSDYGENTASNSKKPAIQNLGDDKKVVLRTKAKSDQIPYYECIETCEICVCDKRAPEFAMCFCGNPKAAGRALPI